jgi:hypothetical protein
VTANSRKLEIFKEYVDLQVPDVEPGTEMDEEAKGYVSPFRGGVQPYGQGGPDAFGYRWIDSDEPGGPPFQWIEIEGNGGINTGIACDDCNVGPFALGFDFPFYGTNFNSIRVASNGFLSFTSTSTAFGNQCPFTTTLPNNTVAPFWDDLDLRTRGAVLYRSEPAMGRFIVEYKRVARYGAAAGDTLTFQTVLCRDGSIQFNYLAMSGVINSASIGIENATGGAGNSLMVNCNTNYVHAGLSVLIQNEQEWLSVSPTSGTIAPSGSQNLDVMFDPTGLSLGMHTGFLRINTNDPLQPKVVIPVCFLVEEPPIAVALARFEAASTPDGVTLQWETASESNHSHFDVLRTEAGQGSWVRLNQDPVTGDGAYEYTDVDVVDGSTYHYRLEAVDRNGARQEFGPLVVTYEGRPAAFQLAQNFPNPFSSRTAFRFDLPQAGKVTVRIYDTVGRLVKTFANGEMAAGRYDYEWNGTDDAGNRVAQGFYFLRAEAPSNSKTVRMMIIR